MREALLEYYERELTYLRQMGGDFARKYPRVAGRLLLDPDSCEDPHVERLIESFAFLAARVHLRIDDDFPELSESLLNMIYPGYLRPVPAMTVVECRPDRTQGKKTAGVRIPRGTTMVTKKTVVENIPPCRFRTAYDVDLWPFKVVEAEWRKPELMQWPPLTTGSVPAFAAARLKIRCFQDVVFQGLPLSQLRFYLAGDASVVYALYELLSANCVEIQLRDPKNRTRVISLGVQNIRMVGLEPDENVLPTERRSMDGHWLIQEYFAFPEKFLFFDLSGLEPLTTGGFEGEAEIVFLFSKYDRADRQQVLELGVGARTFRLGCTPVINLFQQTAEPILLSHTRHDYTIVPDNRHAATMEVYRIEEVIAANPKLRQSTTLEPIFSYRYQTRNATDRAFWTATRHMNEIGEREPSAMKISIVDLIGNIKDPEADVLTVRTLCTNFDLASRLAFGNKKADDAGDDSNEPGDFEAVGHAAAKTVVALRRPTASLDPPSGKGQLWRLISHLSLNYLSLTQEGREALQEILRLHDFTGSVFSENQIGAITKLRSSPHFALVQSQFGLVPARGTHIEMELDEQQFAGGGAYLFTAVLNRFLAGYASMNSFTQLTVRTNQRKEAIASWQPRAGMQVLL
jgi:type VI secretion system protein ImpG